MPTIVHAFQRVAQDPNKPEFTTIEQARQWYRDRAARVRSIDNRIFTEALAPEDVQRFLNMESLGKMYMFFYDPKWKNVLPFYDRFPLCFPIHFYEDGFLGLNLHYLPHRERAVLMDSLYTTANNTEFDRTTRLMVTYRTLQNTSSMSYFKPCIKRYLYAHVESPYLNIRTEDWDIALTLPTERFVKRRKDYVFNNSRSRLGIRTR